MFSHYFYEGDNFCDFLFASLQEKAFSMGSTLEGKNLLQGE